MIYKKLCLNYSIKWSELLRLIKDIGFADNRLGGSATAFPACKVSAQKGLF
jgi:hypothetical protein